MRCWQLVMRSFKIAGSGRTILFVSHNMAAIEALCRRSIHLATTVVKDGKKDEVVSSYLDKRNARLHRMRMTGAGVCNWPVTNPDRRCGRYRFAFRAEKGGQIHQCAVLIYSIKGLRVALVDIRECAALPFKFGIGRFAIRAQIAAMPLVEGNYTVGLWLVTNAFTGNLLELEDLWWLRVGHPVISCPIRLSIGELSFLKQTLQSSPSDKRKGARAFCARLIIARLNSWPCRPNGSYGSQ